MGTFDRWIRAYAYPAHGKFADMKISPPSGAGRIGGVSKSVGPDEADDVGQRDPQASRELAASLAAVLRRKVPSLQAVCVYGSVARGQAGRGSDIDLLALGTDPTLSGARLIKLVEAGHPSVRPSVAYFTIVALKRLLDSGDSFGLHLRREAEVLWERDASFTSLLASDEPPVDVRYELGLEIDRLEALEGVHQYNGLHHFAGAQLFAVGKSVVILRLLNDGLMEFNRARAFLLLVERHPELRAAVSAIRRLEPAWQTASRRSTFEAVPEHRLQASDLTAAVTAIRAIAEI